MTIKIVDHPRHHALDLLRGLAALGVASYHLLSGPGLFLQSLGTFGVYLFFILSALTMMLVYSPTFQEQITKADLKNFYWHRFSRIFPLLIAVALINLLLSAPHSSFRLLAGQSITALLTGSGLFALQLPGFLSNTMGAWSLGIEVLFYLLFPVMCLLLATIRFLTLTLLTLCFIASQQMLMVLLGGFARSDVHRFWEHYSTMLTFVPFFMIGLMIFRATTIKRQAWLLPMFLCCVGIAGFSLAIPLDLFVTPGAYLFLTLLSAVTVLASYCSTVPRPLIGISSFLGNISYALYLTHPLSLRLSEALSDTITGGPAMAGFIFFPLALLVAHTTFVFFERPAQQYLRRWVGGQPAPLAAVAGEAPLAVPPSA